MRKVYRIADTVQREHDPGAEPRLAYPYAVEYDGNLYVIYSAATLPGNLNDAELAIIPVDNLKAD